MKAYIKEFVYKKKEDEDAVIRRVFVLKENNEYVEGYDLKYLTEEQKNIVFDKFKDSEVKTTFEYNRTPKKEAQEETEEDKLWKQLSKAIRKFSKSKFVDTFTQN